MPCAAHIVSDSPREEAAEESSLPFPFLIHFTGAQHDQKLKVNVPDVEFIEEECNPFAIEITTCVRIHAMQTCPAEFYSNSSECQMARRFFTRCMEDMQANAVVGLKEQEMLQLVEKFYRAASIAKIS